MIRVGIISTNWNVHRCGVAEYTRLLISNKFDPEIEFTPIFGPYDAGSLLPRVLAGNFDVVHFQYEGGFLGIFSPGVATRFRANGARLVLTLHDHWPRNNREKFPVYQEFDKIIVHQNTGDGANFVTMPHGIDVLDHSPWSPSNAGIGTCGFPLPQKGILLVAQAAAILGVPCTMVCPESQHIDTHMIERQVKAIWPHTDYITAWMPQRDVQLTMAKCLATVFPMRDGKDGISASVRMGVATGGYTVLSRSQMFSDWWGDERYSGEIEWIDGPANDITPQLVADAVLRASLHRRRPVRILEDMSWKKSAALHADLYRSLVGVAA